MEESRSSKTESLEKFERYLENRELSQNTVSAYMGSMRCFFSHYQRPTKTNGTRWKGDLLGSGLSPKTVNIRLNAFNAYCAMLGNDCEKVKTVRVHNATAISNVISFEDYQRLLSGLLADGNQKWYFAIRLLASTGARVSEYIRLKKADLDRGYSEMWTKGKIRRIYIPESFREEAFAFFSGLGGNDFLIQNRYGGQITSRGVSQMLLKFSKRYGIPKEVMHPHAFRHLFALEFLKRNSNLSLLSDVLGHSSVSTTAIYTRMTKEQQQNAVNSIICW